MWFKMGILCTGVNGSTVERLSFRFVPGTIITVSTSDLLLDEINVLSGCGDKG